MTKSYIHISRGARILMVIFLLLFFVLFGRIVYIQVTKKVEGQALTAYAAEKWTKERVIEAKRGEILDRNGIGIATNAPSYTVFAIINDKYTTNPKKPHHITDAKEAAKKLAPILDMDERKIEDILNKDADQVEFGLKGRNINEQVKEKIEKLNIPGIGFIKETKRFYPNGTFASHVIGYANYNKDKQLQGEMGIEKTLNKYLEGKDGKISYQTDRTGLKLPDPKEMITPPINGNNVYLTIDQKIQSFLEAALSQVEKEYSPEKIMAIVANPKTGEILAMSNRPSFDPNVKDISNYMNDTVSYSFEPGSTMKVFTLSATINEGVFNPNEKFLSGSYRLSNKVNPIRDHNKIGWGTITYLEGVQRSSNVAFAKMVNEKIGTEKFLEYLQRFKFEKSTGIDLPNEATGTILYRYPLEKITTSFGQGTTVTPIQQIQGFTAIANDGKMFKPYIISKIIDTKTGKPIKENKPEIAGEPITADTAKKVRDILETVVSSPNGTGSRYQVEGYSVAGKTGTAQMPDPKTGKYLKGHGNNIFSFLGMAPAENPELIMYVAVQKPKISNFEVGSEPVAKIFTTVIKNSLHYLNVAPTETEKKVEVTVDEGIDVTNYTGLLATNIQSSLKEKGMSVVILGSGTTVVEQVPKEGTKLLPGEKLLLLTDGAAKIPNLSGWSMREVMRLTSLLNLKPNIIGKGYVVKQNIEPGLTVKDNDYLVVELKSPNPKDNIDDQEKIEKEKQDKENPEVKKLEAIME